MEVNWGVFWAIMLAVICYHFGQAIVAIVGFIWNIFMGEEAREERAYQRSRAAKAAKRV